MSRSAQIPGTPDLEVPLSAVACFLCCGPADATVAELVRIAAGRSRNAFQTAKNETGVGLKPTMPQGWQNRGS